MRRKLTLMCVKSWKDEDCKLRIYLDTAPVIYVVERRPLYAEYLDVRLSIPGDSLLTSELTRMECLVLPIREDNRVIVQDYEAYFATRIGDIVSLTREVIDAATLIRARYGFATPDAIHLGAAMAAGCDVFLTNDSRLSRFKEMSVEVVGDNLRE